MRNKFKEDIVMRTKRILVVILALLLTLPGLPSISAAAETTDIKTVTYTPDYETIFANPERGYYQRIDILSPGEGTILNADYDRPYLTEGEAGASVIRVLHSYIRLDNFAETPKLPQSLLDNLSAGLTEVRKNGLKIILRCAYGWGTAPDVPMDIILSHVEQIGRVISANADVVLAVEGGYFGPWGEWHSSEKYTIWEDWINPGKVSAKNDRARLVKAILQSTPENVFVAIRQPMYIREFLSNDLFTQAEKDRIAHHNDSFMADEFNAGTYYNQQSEFYRQFMYGQATSAGFTKYMGGETEYFDPDYVDGYKVLDDAFKLNLTTLNYYHNIRTLTIWRNTNLPASGNDPAETTYERLNRKMGYRLRLVSATFGNFANPGDSFSFSAVIDNDGYAGPLNSRPVYLVFDNGTIRRNVRLTGVEVRSWLGGDDHCGPYNIEAQDIKVPADLPAGNYTLALWLPDSSERLQANPNYSIRLANKYMWDAQKGYNKLGVVTIGATDAGMSSWAKADISTAITTGLVTPELAGNYKATTTRAEFCRAAVHLLEQYYNMPAAGILYKRSLASSELPHGFIFSQIGTFSANLNEVAEGRRSVVGRYSGPNIYNAVIMTDPGVVTFEPSKTYTVRFRCKILETPNQGFEVLFYSPKGGEANHWLTSKGFTGKAGDQGEVTYTIKLGPYDDYQIVWNIRGKGAVALDSISVVEEPSGKPIFTADFEEAPVQKSPLLGTNDILELWHEDQVESLYGGFMKFTDTTDPAISAAAALGITSGTGGGKFSPDAPLTREQAATMLVNVLKIIGVDTTSAPAVKWTDDNSISSWAQTAADVMYGTQIMKGTSTTALVFSPKAPFTHEQSILTLNNLWKFLQSN